MRQHSWWFWIVVVSVSAIVIVVVSLVVLRLPEAWRWWASLVFLAIGGALSFWADVGGIRSSLRGEEVTRELIVEQEKTRAVMEALPKRMREETIAALSDFINGRAMKVLEIPIVTEDEFVQEQQEKLRAGRVDEVIKTVEKHKVERVSEYSALLAIAYLLKGDIEFHAGRFDLAEHFYHFSLHEAQDSGDKELVAECCLELGVAVGKQGKYQEAERCLLETIKLRPNHDQAYYNLGVVYGKRDEYDQAIANYNKAIELNPDGADAYNNRGTTYYYKREYDLAIADYDRTIKLRPDDPQAYYNRGIAYRDRGEYDLAIVDYGRAIELKPEFASAYYNRAMAYGDKGSYDLAIADLNKVLRLKPDDAEAYFTRGLAYAFKREYDLTIADFSRAIKLKPDYADAYWVCGLVHRTMDEKEEAIRNFQRFWELSEDEDLRREAEEHLKELRGQ